MLNKNKKKWIANAVSSYISLASKEKWILIGVLGFVALILNILSYVQQQIDYKQDIIFVENHNSSIAVLESEEEVFPTTEPVVQKKVKAYEPKSTFVNNKDYGVKEDGDDELEVEKEKILPYTNTLPLVPDIKLSKKYFIDTSKPGTAGYNVRDDIEIAIVEEYGDNSRLVETSFAYAASLEHMQRMSLDNNITAETLQESWDATGYFVECSILLIGINEYFSDDFRKESKELFDSYLNTEERKSHAEKVRKSSGGGRPRVYNITQKSCDAFYKKTKTWDFR